MFFIRVYTKNHFIIMIQLFFQNASPHFGGYPFYFTEDSSGFGVK